MNKLNVKNNYKFRFKAAAKNEKKRKTGISLSNVSKNLLRSYKNDVAFK